MANTLQTSQIPSSACPYCERVYAVTTSVGGKASPQPGSWAVCVNCAQFLVYDDDLTVRKPHQGEVASMTRSHPGTRRLLDRAAAMVRQRDRRGAT